MNKALADILTLAACVALPTSALAGVGVYDYSEQTHEYHADITFSGHPVIVETTSGRLGLRHDDTIVGYYGGGTPRVIGFGCEGADMPIIAMEEDELPRCDRVEGITPY